MGMFDYVDVTIKCSKCGEKVQGFQTKDHECGLHNLKFEDLNEGDEFYSYCAKCERNYTFYVKVDKLGNKYVKTLEEQI